MPEEAIPPVLRDIVPVRRQLAIIAGEAGLTLAELALRYMLTQEGVASILTGVETIVQIRENIALFNRGPLPADVLVAVDNVVPDLPETILTPALWRLPHAK